MDSDNFRFGASDSRRWRNGARFSWEVSEKFTPYIGAYHDYEFDGKGRTSVYGFGVDSASLRGGTGVGELGFTLRPAKDSPLSTGFGVQGYTGVRRGMTGSLEPRYEF